MRLTETEVVAEVETVTLHRLRLWVRQGWVLPTAGKGGPFYDETDLARIRLVCQLTGEMNLNDDAVPVVLSLMDQLYGMRREFKALAQAVAEQPTEVRVRLRERHRRLLGE